ncbi:MAG: O-methyltransferase [Actinomycetota bacterium]|nr:O-methyltransferase [Solirubrobacterales bacterium]MDQ3090520.1 O-methyltransferase [Actinomycetota bacterium]
MSLLDEAVEAYAEAQTTPAAEHLRTVARETADELGSTAMLTGPVEGRLLETLVFATQPQLVLEIGTFSGYSALSMVPALPDGGRIVTCELDDERADFAQRHIDAAGAGDRIEIRRGAALESIAALDGPFDLVFVDADKRGYVDYYEAVLPKLASRGLILADNTLAGGRAATDADDDTARAIRAFNDHVAADPRTVQVLLTVRDGITLIRRAQTGAT